MVRFLQDGIAGFTVTEEHYLYIFSHLIDIVSVMSCFFLSPCLQVSATDVDTGINGTVQYYLGTSQTSPNSHENNDASLFQIDRSTGQISLNKQLSLSDLGHAFKVYIIASDMSSRPLQTQAIMTILVDETAPKGANAAKVSGSSGFTKTVSDSLVSLFIIIFIVAAAFIISGVLLTAVCIVLNRSRRSSGSSHTMRE